MDRDVERILTDVELCDSRHVLASDLSGGQKRRLCLAISFASCLYLFSLQIRVSRDAGVRFAWTKHMNIWFFDPSVS